MAWRQTIVNKDQSMKPKFFAASAAIILFTSTASNAGHGYFNLVGRNFGYGISDGYHAHRSCLTDWTPCHECSPAQQPMMQPPIITQPTMAPADSQASPQRFQQVGYPVASPIVPHYRPWQQPAAPSFAQPPIAPFAIPNRTPAVQ
jgi:hypothetical protein